MSTVLRDPQRVHTDESVSIRAQRILGEAFMTLWDDPAVRELYVNADGQVWVNRSGAGRQRAAGLVLEEVAVLKFLGAVAAYRREVLTPEKPSLQAAMPEARFGGARLQGYIPPRAPGPGFNLRKHASHVPNLGSYIERGALSLAEFDLLLESVDRRRNILVVGATGSGKTTFLNALIAVMADRWPEHRLLIVEETPEIQCAAPDCVLYRTLPGEAVGPAITRETMRLYPDRICFGEYRDVAARHLFDLWTTGHNGGAATTHANSIEGALLRTNRMMLNGRRGSYAELITEGLGVVVLMERGPVGGVVADLGLVDGLDGRGRFRILRPRAGAKPRRTDG